VSGCSMSHKSDRIEVALETLFESVDRPKRSVCAPLSRVDLARTTVKKFARGARGVVNAIRYGNQGAAREKILLTFALYDDKFVVHILDQATA